MTPGMPPLNLSLATNSRSGDISAPNTVNFGGFGPGSGGSGMPIPWPLLAVAAVVLIVLKR